MDILFGTVVRGAPIKKGGELVKLDWDNKFIKKKITIYPKNPEIIKDPNPRGNTRGCKGIDIYDNNVIVATYHSLEIYDKDLNYINRLSDNLMVCLHEIYCNQEGKVWVASTAIDAAIKYNLKTGKLEKAYWPREMENIQKELNISRLEIDKKLDNRFLFLDTEKYRHNPSHTHLNAVNELNGEMYCLLHRFGAIVNLDKQEIIIKDKRLDHSHNLKFIENNIAIVNNSYNNSINFYDLYSRKLIKSIDLLKHKLIKKIQTDTINDNRLKISIKKYLSRFGVNINVKSKSIFVRGLDIDKDYIYVGISPASIICINWKTNDLVDYFQYSNDSSIAIHGLKILY